MDGRGESSGFGIGFGTDSGQDGVEIPGHICVHALGNAPLKTGFNPIFFGCFAERCIEDVDFSKKMVSAL